jgi:hypothetical protein
MADPEDGGPKACQTDRYSLCHAIPGKVLGPKRPTELGRRVTALADVDEAERGGDPPPNGPNGSIGTGAYRLTGPKFFPPVLPKTCTVSSSF